MAGTADMELLLATHRFLPKLILLISVCPYHLDHPLLGPDTLARL